MPVAALSEIGLIIDVFGEKPKVIKSIDYVLKNNCIVSYFAEKLKFISIVTMEIKEIEFEKIKEMKLSSNGVFLAIKTMKNELVVFKHTEIIARYDKIDEFDITNEHVYYSTEYEFYIYTHVDSTCTYKTMDKPLYVVALENNILYLTPTFGLHLVSGKHGKYTYLNTENIKSTDQFDVIPFEDYTNNKIFQYKTASKIIVEECEEGMLILSETSYSSVTYFAQLELHYFMRKPNNEFKVLQYKNMGDILHVGFMKNEFFVVFGGQPANCCVFDKTTGAKTDFVKKATRNFVDFNKSKKRVLCGAFGNLPGIVTVFENNIKTCEFESLGSSIFKWLKNGTNFLVATTNYFKEGNKIDIYDYYGRKLETMECKSLYKLDVYGGDEEEVVLLKPEKMVQIKKQEYFEIPQLEGYETKPSNKSKSKVEATKNKKQQPKKSTAPKKIVLSKELIEKELAEAKTARKKLQSGEECTLEEENKAFSVSALEAELEEFMNKQT